MMKLRRRTKILVSEGKESAHDVHLINADVIVKNHPASMEELQSPVFRRSSFSEDNAQMESRPMLMGGQESSLTPPEFGVSRDMPEDSIPLGVSELFPCALGYSNDVWQPESPGAPVTSVNQEAAQPCSESGESVSFDASGKKKSFRAIKEMDSESICEDQGELRRLLDLMSENELLPTDTSNSMINESKIHGENSNDIGSLNAFPSELPLDDAKKLVENQQLEIQSRLSPQEKVTAPESALNSCTVVEGLPFPVEYYVRTTRRMSNCQRKVDLDAVILSHLGRSKKGQRSKCKQKDRSLGHSSQETVENHLESTAVPFLCSESDPVNSSPQKHLLTSSGSSTSPGSISQNSVRSTKRDQRQSQRKQKGKRKATCRPLANETSQELIESLDLTKPRESSKQKKTRPSSGFRGCCFSWPSCLRPMSGSLFSFRSFQWLAPKLDIKDFHLPDEEFGLLKLGKYESSPGNDLEVFVPSVFGDGVASEDAQTPEINAEEKELKTSLLSPFKNRLSELPHLESPAAKVELSTHELLFTPMGTLLTGAPAQRESQISSSVFPVLGATPAVLPSVCSEIFPNTCSVPPLKVSLHSSKEAPAQVKDNRECKDSAIPLHLDSSEQLTPVLLDGLREENLQFVSRLKDSSSSSAVDVNSVWWEAAGCRELCVVTACESSVSLWKPQALDCWEKVYTWQLGEIPVIQIIPLPDTCNLVCIALGNLEIGEIRLLLYSSENDSFKQSLVKSGNIKAVLGLKDGRLVSSSRAMQEQQVEIVSLSETGRCKDRQTLMPPEETVLAFAEVEGVRDALVGTTAVNSVAVWNLKTGQLLKKMHIGYSYPASICHRAYSDSGLLFVVLSHPHAKESESCGNPAFRVIAFNPKTARSTGVMFSSLPPGHTGRQVPRGCCVLIFAVPLRWFWRRLS
uniref:Partner and localiser of BRCA2 WD40 domain-containing protein n=1 Tax=Chrysolophus pictus TaxID=9089 RepID=A0A8C3KZA4_CHRPC